MLWRITEINPWKQFALRSKTSFEHLAILGAWNVFPLKGEVSLERVS